MTDVNVGYCFIGAVVAALLTAPMTKALVLQSVREKLAEKGLALEEGDPPVNLCELGKHDWTRWEQGKRETWQGGKVVGYQTAIRRECVRCGRVEVKAL